MSKRSEDRQDMPGYFDKNSACRGGLLISVAKVQLRVFSPKEDVILAIRESGSRLSGQQGIGSSSAIHDPLPADDRS